MNLSFLKGYRSYLAAAAAGLALFAQQAGLVTPEQGDLLLKAAAIAFGVFLRAATLSQGDTVVVQAPAVTVLPDTDEHTPLASGAK